MGPRLPQLAHDTHEHRHPNRDSITSLQPLALVHGTRLGPYEVLSVSGAGGMGELYRAIDAGLKRQVATRCTGRTGDMSMKGRPVFS